MNTFIEEMESDVHVIDGRAMLAPEVLEQIVAAVLLALREQEHEMRNRQNDTRLDRQALVLD